MMLGPQPLGGLTQQTGWYQREVSSDADIVAFCSLVGDPSRVAELVAGVREVVSSVRFGCTLFAVRSLSKSELADVATTPGECPEDATLPLRLFVSAPTTGKAKSGMHTAMLVATFNRAKRGRVVAQTGALDERCATHSRGLSECVEERKREGKLGCDADKVCIGHAASTRALLSRAACPSCIRKRASRASSKRPLPLHFDAFFVPRRLVPNAERGETTADVCVRRAMLHTLRAKAYCPEPNDDALCTWDIDGPALSQRRRRREQ